MSQLFETDYTAHAHPDLLGTPDVMIQLMARSDFYDMLFGALHSAASKWDGKTAPVRLLDPATGTLIPRDQP